MSAASIVPQPYQRLRPTPRAGTPPTPIQTDMEYSLKIPDCILKALKRAWPLMRSGRSSHVFADIVPFILFFPLTAMAFG